MVVKKKRTFKKAPIKKRASPVKKSTAAKKVTRKVVSRTSKNKDEAVVVLEAITEKVSSEDTPQNPQTSLIEKPQQEEVTVDTKSSEIESVSEAVSDAIAEVEQAVESQTQDIPPGEEMSQQQKETLFPEWEKERKSMRAHHVLGLFTFVLIATVILASLFLYLLELRKDQHNFQFGVTPTVAPTQVPSPTPEVIDKLSYSIRILNGSGIAGEAGRIKTLLDEDGFSVAGTGNADKYDYEDTVVKTKADVSSEFVEMLKESLAKRKSVYSIDELEESNPDDVVVIVGRTASNAASVTPSR